ncbi:hypothetical protein CBW65_18705 [Tumebacillus avium]|uniref:Uncharacterized protein n=1 Tax=Tumebacillus avium TaxID=1903704 RepID=A0A1Y0ITQ1_9BACL|nr:hypothetical protein [Tumebacillus avium]ARU62773.1 hypothetical protein CBW65_18705 [Tumebacillus avium]
MLAEFELRSNSITCYRFILDIEQLQVVSDELSAKLTFHPQFESPIGLLDDYISLLGGHVELDSRVKVDIPVQAKLPGRPFWIPLSNKMIQYIEENRVPQQEIEISLSFYAVCHIPNNYYRSRNDSEWEKRIDQALKLVTGKMSTFTVYPPVRVRIHREKWSNLLKDAGYKSFELLELPTLNLRPKQSDRWLQVTGRFEEFIHKERMGYYEDCMRNARILLEDVMVLLASHTGVQLNQKQASGKIESLVASLKKRFPTIIDSIESLEWLMKSINLSSRAHHHGGEVVVAMGGMRKQVKYISYLLAALLSASVTLLEDFVPENEST